MPYILPRLLRLCFFVDKKVFNTICFRPYKPIKLIFIHVCAGKPKCTIDKLYNNFAIEG